MRFFAVLRRWLKRNQQRWCGSPCGLDRRRSASSTHLPMKLAATRTWRARIAAALGEHASTLLATPPVIERIDVLAAKLPLDS